MNKFIKKNISIIIAIFILLGPVLDLLTGLCLHIFKINFTIGIIIRVMFLLFICFITLFVYKKKKVLIPYSLILIYMIFYIMGIIIYKNGGLFREIQGLIKVFYYPIILISIYQLREEVKITTMTLFTTLFLYLIFIFVPLLFGIGFDTYEVTKEGTLGFYNSANEISGIISILTPIMFIVLIESKKWIPRIVLISMYLVVILMIGTKTPLISFIITVFASIIYFWIKNIKEKHYKNVFISLGILLVGLMGLILIIPKTTFYKNIEVHLKFLKVDEVEDVFENERVFDHFIFSQRLTFLSKRQIIYKDSNTYQKLFGLGYLDNDLNDYKMIEMDFFDVFYNHGIIGFLIFTITCFYILYKFERKRNKKSFSRYMYDLSTCLILLLAMITGHILTAPAVSLIVVVILLNNYKQTKKKKSINNYLISKILE